MADGAEDPKRFDPFAMVKGISLETRFTHAEARFLIRAVMHTDNASMKHRHSLVRQPDFVTDGVAA